MTAVANPPSFPSTNRSPWGASVGQGGLNSMNNMNAMSSEEVARMFMPRKSAQRANSSSSISSNSSASSSSTSTIGQSTPLTNGVPMTAGDNSMGTAVTRKKPQRAGPWPTSKAEAISGVSTARPQSLLFTNGLSAASSMTSIHQTAPILPSQHVLQNPSQQSNGARPAAQSTGEGNPVLYLLAMNGTFERKTIAVPYYPDSLRIGRQTNAKTIPTPTNGFFDSKVLSRQHAEIWADRSGKVWIRDVKSSNGTFVNGARLSAENRDSEPHELATQDHLELGIDIVSEDQKTVVHHKVAAKVEHAGFLGATNNVLEMNFGDLDPANGAMMVPSQGSIQMRGRSSSQGSVGSNGRMGPPVSVAGSQMSAISQQRPMNFWLTPVTTEQIVKRLTHEMRVARSQANDLGRADNFLGTLVTKHDVKEAEKQAILEPTKTQQSNGGSLPFRDANPRFSDPPAPPPQQPLPEKPDVTRSHGFEPTSPSLKRTNTERPRSVPNVSPIRHEPSSQIISLIEALASAKKEIDTQNARVRDLEETLLKERQARELAEDLAKRLESESEIRFNGHNQTEESSKIQSSLDPGSETPVEEKPGSKILPNGKVVDPNAISESTLLLEKRLESMLGDMQAMKEQMDAFKVRAETAELERDADRKTLSEMVQKIRADEASSLSALKESASSSPGNTVPAALLNGKHGEATHLSQFLQNSMMTNGHTVSAENNSKLSKAAVSTLSRPPGDPMIYHTTPYVSMIGVVLLGMGLMAYMNGWQPPKVER
ncbi:hypothetical protein HYALB_00000407 [Hymenoscyphus albidus]|uniref:FHA domain-containing protein n=1 Tax=Hymenoscyphus albidus TaxID=595503 RepID=A0A9N9LG69_9HELO|nr:hypothetical protein HYALB_00000407 [Hymenoscyphus albidus]